MRLTFSNIIQSPVGLALLTNLLCSEAFTISTKSSFGLPNKVAQLQDAQSQLEYNVYATGSADTALFAKKKKGKVPVAATMDFDLFDEDEPMSKKDQMKEQKRAAKEAKKEAAAKQEEEAAPAGKKDRKAAALKALEEMERMDAQMAGASNGAEEKQPQMSKKEAKMAAKKAAKMEAKKEAKEAKRAAKRAAAGGDAEGEVEPDLAAINGEAGGEDAVVSTL